MYDGNTSEPPVYADKQVCACEYSVCKAESFACMTAEILFWKWKNMLMSNSRTCQTAIFDGTSGFLFIYLFLKYKAEMLLARQEVFSSSEESPFPRNTHTHTNISLEISFISIIHIDKAQRAPLPSPPPPLPPHSCALLCMMCRNQKLNVNVSKFFGK